MLMRPQIASRNRTLSHLPAVRRRENARDQPVPAKQGVDPEIAASEAVEGARYEADGAIRRFNPSN
jgi:hypothetical protein